MTARPLSNISSPDRVDADGTERSVFLLRLEAKPGPAGIHPVCAGCSKRCCAATGFAASMHAKSGGGDEVAHI